MDLYIVWKCRVRACFNSILWNVGFFMNQEFPLMRLCMREKCIALLRENIISFISCRTSVMYAIESSIHQSLKLNLRDPKQLMIFFPNLKKKSGDMRYFRFGNVTKTLTDFMKTVTMCHNFKIPEKYMDRLTLMGKGYVFIK